MQDAELFVSLAEIAGIFVGFGALISIRTDSTSDEYEVTMIRMIVWGGIMVIVAALAPVIISHYGVTGHALWVACSLTFLVLFWGGSTVMERLNPERTRYLGSISRKERIRIEMPGVFLWLPMSIALILILVGPFPHQEPALYLTAVALALFMDALLLLYLVYRQGHPQPA